MFRELYLPRDLLLCRPKHIISTVIELMVWYDLGLSRNLLPMVHARMKGISDFIPMLTTWTKFTLGYYRCYGIRVFTPVHCYYTLYDNFDVKGTLYVSSLYKI